MKTMDNNNNFTTKINNVHPIPNENKQILIIKEYPKNLDLYVQQIKSKEKIFEKAEITLSELEKNFGLFISSLVIVKVLIEGKIYNAEIVFGFKCWDDMKEYPKIMGIRTNDCIEKGTNITFIA